MADTESPRADMELTDRATVDAILALLPMDDDGTGHIVACGWDDAAEHPTCGCYDLPQRIATVLADRLAAAELAITAEVRDVAQASARLMQTRAEKAEAERDDLRARLLAVETERRDAAAEALIEASTAPRWQGVENAEVQHWLRRRGEQIAARDRDAGGVRESGERDAVGSQVRPPASSPCPCGCAPDMHIGDIGCSCGLPDEAPCAEPRHEDWCCANGGCAGYGGCHGCAGTEADCKCLVAIVRRYVRAVLASPSTHICKEWLHRPENDASPSALHHLAEEWIEGADLSPETEAEVRWMAGELLTALAALPSEWGVRYPSGAVESYGDDEHRARRFALATTNLRPDLPTLVVRKVVTPWECVTPPGVTR
jgi:hypothetical protein